MPRLQDEAAQLMYAPTTTLYAVAGYKFNLGMVCVNDCVATYFQTQPLCTFINRHISWSGASVPRG